MSHLLRRSAWCVAIGAVALGALVPAMVPVDAATKTTRKTTKATKTTKTTKRTVTTKRAVATTKPAVTTTTVAVATTVAAATIAPSTTATAVPTTIAVVAPPTTTTVAAPSYDFTLRLTQPSQKAAPGSTVSFIVVAEQRAGALGPVLLLPTGIPAGVSATLDQNPILSAGEMKFVLPATLATGFYEVRINGTSNNVSRTVIASILVEGAVATTTTSATTTTGVTTTTRPTYKYSVIVSNPAGTLSTGGSLSYPITINRDSGNNDTISLAASELPTNVWVGFSDNPVGTNATMWLSSTLPLKAGSYKFNLVITSLGTAQSIPLTVNIV
jgi:hypothetical protein